MSSSPNDSFNPVDFYIFASQLYIQSTDEAAYRTIIGRSYYAVALYARDYANITNSGRSLHQEIIAFFRTRDIQIYNQIRGLKNLRNKADYKLIETVQRRESGESLRLAKNILTRLNYLT